MEVRYHFGCGMYVIKNTRTRKNAMLPVSFLTLGYEGSHILKSSASYTRTQLIRRMIEDNSRIIKPLLNGSNDIEKIHVSEVPEAYVSTSTIQGCTKTAKDTIFPALHNMIIEVVDEDSIHTHFVLSVSERWNRRILDYAIQPYLYRNFGKDITIDPINDSLGYLLKQIWNWNDEALDKFYDKKRYEPILYPVASQKHKGYVSLMGQVQDLSMIECPDNVKKELSETARKFIAIFASALYPNLEPSSILLLGTEYASTLTAIKYIKLQYKKYLMISSKFIEDPQGGLTEAPIYEITQNDEEMNIEVLSNQTTVVYPEEFGYENQILGDRIHKYPEKTDLYNMQLLLD